MKVNQHNAAYTQNKKRKNQMIVSIDAGKHLTKPNTHFSQQTRIKREFLYLIKGVYSKPIANNIFGGKGLFPSSLRSATRKDVCSYHLYSVPCANSNHCNNARRTRRHTDWKRRNNTIFVCGWHDCLHEKYKGINKNLKLVREFSKLPG